MSKWDVMARLEILYHKASRVDSKTRAMIPSWCTHSIQYLNNWPSNTRWNEEVIAELVTTLEFHEITINKALDPPVDQSGPQTDRSTYF